MSRPLPSSVAAKFLYKSIFLGDDILHCLLCESYFSMIDSYLQKHSLPPPPPSPLQIQAADLSTQTNSDNFGLLHNLLLSAYSAILLFSIAVLTELPL